MPSVKALSNSAALNIFGLFLTLEVCATFFVLVFRPIVPYDRDLPWEIEW